ncbi:MAG TPA: hypothetical protein PLL20_13645 [Phycisphaerae bacterium]|nr:hypothetical protein [Phycisphaerae bacterium]HRR84516.1 hypothetical protein [Phycisphaerae bacterium]
MSWKTDKDSPILVSEVGGRQVCTVHAAEVPAERRSVVELSRPNESLTFVNSKGGVTSFALSSLFDEGRHLFLCIRIGSGLGVQCDCLISSSGEDPTEGFRQGLAKGVRFQPFYLPESKGNPDELVGRGLFSRGFHFPGTITPVNVSLLCICDYCLRNFRLQSFHAGFSDLTYLYCSQGPHTLVASSYLDDAPPVLGVADAASVSRFESRLPRCEKCGGEFRHRNPLRCPHCGKPYIDFLRHPQERQFEYYGNHLYGDTLQEWSGDRTPS